MLKFCLNFLKHLLKIDKLNSFIGIYFFSQLEPNKKNYDQISSKQGGGAIRAAKEKFEKI